MSCSLALSLALTLHLAPGDFNEIHPHARVHCGDTISGVYLNSQNQGSFYVGRKQEWGSLWLEYGVVTGYEYPLVPLVGAGKDLADSVSVFTAPMQVEGKPGILLGLELRR